MFIVIEGPNGTGKTTTVSALAEILRGRGEEVLVTAEPTNTDLGRLLRFAGEEISGPTLALGVAADRMMHLTDEIEPATSKGIVVICDRYVPSSLVLQRIDDLDVEWVMELNKMATPPDLTIYLSEHEEILATRLAERKGRSRLEERGGPALELQYYGDAFSILERRGWAQVKIDCHGRLAEEVASEIVVAIDSLSSSAYK